MKLMCIKQGKWGDSKTGPSYGEEVTTAGEYKDDSGDYWLLAEYERDVDGIRVCFWKRHFIPLSSIDETEMERDYKTETV